MKKLSIAPINSLMFWLITNLILAVPPGKRLSLLFGKAQMQSAKIQKLRIICTKEKIYPELIC